MDMHLNFIVDQTQKYSSWLMQGLMTTPTSTNTPSEPSLISTASNEGISTYTVNRNMFVEPNFNPFFQHCFLVLNCCGMHVILIDL